MVGGLVFAFYGFLVPSFVNLVSPLLGVFIGFVGAVRLLLPFVFAVIGFIPVSRRTLFAFIFVIFLTVVSGRPVDTADVIVPADLAFLIGKTLKIGRQLNLVFFQQFS